MGILIQSPIDLSVCFQGPPGLGPVMPTILNWTGWAFLAIALILALVVVATKLFKVGYNSYKPAYIFIAIASIIAVASFIFLEIEFGDLETCKW